jgi:hypothetical protein
MSPENDWSPMPPDDDETDAEEIWEGICETVARHSGISAAKARAILGGAGYHAYGHIGIVDALMVVQHALQQR